MIELVVCTSAGAEPRPECVAALGGDSVKVVSEDTLWQARRRALAECEADVLALLDGDVVVAPGWSARLRAEWEDQPSEIAAIGGPVRAGFARPWELAVYGGVNYGPESFVFDPLERTLVAGNLSFRVLPLRGAGGFEPPVDGRDGCDWLSEEHEAQRQLGHWGWLARYVPELAADRLPPRGRTGVAPRRFRYGVRQGIARSRPAGPAARRAFASALGAPAALAVGRRSLAAERAARAAENAGLALAPVVAGRARQRFAADDGKRAPAAAARRRAAGERPAIVLLYHRVAAPAADPLGLCVAPERFRDQLAILAAELEPVAMTDMAAALRDGGPRAGTVAITFDDGYLDNLRVALPLADEAGVPLAVFAATALVENGGRSFWDEGQDLILAGEARRLAVTVGDRRHIWRTRDRDERIAAFLGLHRLIHRCPPEVAQDVLRQLRDWSGREGATQLMSVDDLRELAHHPRAEVGAHTRNHPRLATLGADAALDEIEGSRRDIARWTGREPSGFAYPFGLPRHDVDDHARRLVAQAGFGYALVNQPMPVLRGTDPYAIPRFYAPDAGGEEFRGWLRTIAG